MLSALVDITLEKYGGLAHLKIGRLKDGVINLTGRKIGHPDSRKSIRVITERPKWKNSAANATEIYVGDEYEFDEEGEMELKAQDVEFRKDPDDKSYPPESE